MNKITHWCVTLYTPTRDLVHFPPLFSLSLAPVTFFFHLTHEKRSMILVFYNGQNVETLLRDRRSEKSGNTCGMVGGIFPFLFSFLFLST
jgi:hypothetical protein